jgi:hypothetical protein
MRVLIVLPLLAAAAAGQDEERTREFEVRLGGARREAAKAHVRIARLCTEEHLWAPRWHELLRAVDLDPKNEEAQKGLGRKLENGAWIPDPDQTPILENDMPAADAAAALSRYRGKRRAEFEPVTAELEELAEMAEVRDLPHAALIWRHILEYFPNHSRALARLGWQRFEGVLIPPDEYGWREQGKRRVLDADEGTVLTQPTEAALLSKFALAGRKTANFVYEGMYSDGEMCAVIRSAEAARSLLVETLGISDEIRLPPVSGIFLRRKGDHERFLNRALELGNLEKIALADLPRWEAIDEHRFESWEVRPTLDYQKEVAAHMTTLFVLRDFARLDETPVWFSQGLAYWVSDRLFGTARVFSVPSMDVKMDRQDIWKTPRWRRKLAQLAWDGVDEPIKPLLKSGVEALTAEGVMKSWSLVDMLIAAGRPAIQGFLADLKRGSASGPALKEALGAKNYAALELKWEAHVREIANPKPSLK